MSTLVKLNTQPTDEYDWSLIEGQNNRAVAKSTVSSYVTQWSALRQQADKLIETNTLALSKCVFTLKETLPHGEFTSVCQQALKLDYQKSSSLATVGRALMNGDVPEEALKLLNQMEPRAARKFLKADEGTKHDYVVRFEESGRVPSQRDFQAPKTEEGTKHDYVVRFEEPTIDEVSQLKAEIQRLKLQLKNMDHYKAESPIPVVELTQSKWDAKDRFTANKIRPVHALEALVDMLSSQKELRSDVESALKALAKEADRLLRCPTAT